MQFTIKRSKWLRGEGESRLLRRGDGKQCCIGQVCSQIGIPDEAIRGRATVYLVAIQTDLDIAPILSGDRVERGWVRKAYKVNDDKAIGDPEREERLAQLAASDGHEFIFVD